MSACDQRLTAYADGELGPQERGSLEAHLGSCATCREEVAALAELDGGLRRALGGLLLHVDLARQVGVGLPEKRRSLVLVKTEGVRRRLALAGFAGALAFVIFSLANSGAQIFAPLARPQSQAALFLDWALMLAAGSMMIWPEKFARVEALVVAAARGRRPEVNPRESVLVQGAGLLFLCISTAAHYLILSRL